MIRALSIFILLALSAPAWAVEVDHINGISITSHKTYDGIWSISKIKAHNGFTLASALTCTLLSSNTSSDTTFEIHRYNNQQNYGLIWDDGSSGSICAIKFYIYDVTGDVTGLDYYAEVWLLDGDSLQDSIIGRSAKVDGAAWSDELVAFTFSTPADYDCTGANQYALVMKAIANDAAATTTGTYSDTNYPRTRYSNGVNTMTGNVSRATWNGAGSYIGVNDSSDMIRVEVWTMQ